MNDQITAFCPENSLPKDHGIPPWNSDDYKVRLYPGYIQALEQRGIFFSYPLDLDFSMLLSHPRAYNVQKEDPDEATLKSVLGKSHHDSSQYSENELKLFASYHKLFKLGSKPAAHIDALAQLSDEDLLANMSESLGRLADAVIAKLEELPE